MKKITLATLTGAVLGLVLGATLMGVNQYFTERQQSDWAEVEKWVFVASYLGAMLGAIAGGLAGLVIGVFRYRTSNDRFRQSFPR